MFQAIKHELNAARSLLSALRARIANGEAIMAHDLHAVEDRIAGAFGHAQAGEVAPVSTVATGAAPSLDTGAADATA